MLRLDFVLIDLFSQLEAANFYLAGWSRAEILPWMAQFGMVEKADFPNQGVSHVFHAVNGLETPFCFNDDGTIRVPHHYWRVRADEAGG